MSQQPDCMLMKFISHVMFTVTGCSQKNLVVVFTTLVVTLEIEGTLIVKTCDIE